MKVSSTEILFLAAITCVKAMVQLQPTQPPPPQCVTSGFAGCECMFVGGCDAKGSKHPKMVKNLKLDGFAPDGIDQFAYVKVGDMPQINLGWVCEGGLLAILYDCKARIPLYAATVIEGNQAEPKVKRTGCFEPSTKIDKAFQQNDQDYDKSRERIFCYEDQKTGALLTWDGKHECQSPDPGKINKGHMVAAGYARADADRIKNTLIYTNCVPQFETFNKGQWRAAENDKLVNNWGNRCHEKAHPANVRIYVVVGAVPTFTGIMKFFGKPGFSNFEGTSKGGGEYRVVVPHTMWTAACCVLDYNTVMDVMAFSRENLPTKDPTIYYNSPQKMVDTLFPPPRKAVNLFPTNAKCMSG